MKLHHCSVGIPEGQENSEVYVSLEHGTRYTLELGNNDKWRCDAEVSIDGQKVGTWRVEKESSIRLERPVHDTGRFTFYQYGTKEATQAGIVNNDSMGVISVVFKPERRVTRIDVAPIQFIRRGGTGLSGHSKQQFSSVKPLSYEDPKEFVTIKLCLMVATASHAPSLHAPPLHRRWWIKEPSTSRGRRICSECGHASARRHPLPAMRFRSVVVGRELEQKPTMPLRALPQSVDAARVEKAPWPPTNTCSCDSHHSWDARRRDHGHHPASLRG